MKKKLEHLDYDAQKYIKRTLDWIFTPSRDAETITQNVRYMYEQTNLDRQVKVIVCSSLDEFSKEIDNVNDNVRNNVRNNVGNNVNNIVMANVRNNVENNVGAYYWADYISFNDVFIAEGVVTDQKLIESFEKWKDCIADISMSFLSKNVAIILTKPKVRQDTSNFLHSDEFPALQWDDTGFYYLHGVKFPEDLWKKIVSHKMPFQDVLAIDDIDQRTQAMKYGDVEEFLAHAGAKTIDTHTKKTLAGKEINYKLVEIPKGETFTQNVHFAIYDCPSTDKTYMSGVPKFDTVAEAMAWKQSNDKYTITPSDWLLSIPLVDES